MKAQEQKVERVLPYEAEAGEKKAQLQTMFDRIAPVYDRANHLFSFNIDRMWRKGAIGDLTSLNPQNMLDVATGTADFALDAARLLPEVRITGIDISEGMMKIGREKIRKKGLEGRIELRYAEVENLPFESNSFDAASVGFGVRNFASLEKGLCEIHRVLKPGGKVIILELSKPKNPLISFFYNIYFQKFVPWFGSILSKDKKAYSYLNRSVEAFPEKEEFARLMQLAGFKNTQWKSLTFGICVRYSGQK